MEIKLVYINKELGKAWEKTFIDEPNIQIIEGDITTIKSDAIVSPANSFGFMDGSLDLILSERFGWHIQEELQEKIQQSDLGELLVGQTLTIETKDPEIPLLISAPTMRVPMNFGIPTSTNSYLAMKAILIACKKDERISSVSIPGLCTGCGRMPFDITAHQMFKAFKEVIHDAKPNFPDFGSAQRHQIDLNRNGMIWTH